MKTKTTGTEKQQLVQSVIPASLWQRLKALALREERSISYMVGKCIRDYLEGK